MSWLLRIRPLARTGQQQWVSRIAQLCDGHQTRLCCRENRLTLTIQHWPSGGQHQSTEVHQEEYVRPSELRLAASTSTGWVSYTYPTESAGEPKKSDSYVSIMWLFRSCRGKHLFFSIVLPHHRAMC